MANKFRVVKIKEPGLINVMIDGKFRDIELHKADDIVLEKLFKDGCPYVQLTAEEYSRRNPQSRSINVTPVNTGKGSSGKKRTTNKKK